MGLEKVLTDLWPFKHSHFGNFLHCRVWSLYNKHLLQLQALQGWGALFVSYRYNILVIIIPSHNKVVEGI